MIVGMGQGLSGAQDVSLSTQGNGIINDQPDWGPTQPSTGTSEVPRPLILPGAAMLIGDLAFMYERRSCHRTDSPFPSSGRIQSVTPSVHVCHAKLSRMRTFGTMRETPPSRNLAPHVR